MDLIRHQGQNEQKVTSLTCLLNILAVELVRIEPPRLVLCGLPLVDAISNSRNTQRQRH